MGRHLISSSMRICVEEKKYAGGARRILHNGLQKEAWADGGAARDKTRRGIMRCPSCSAAQHNCTRQIQIQIQVQVQIQIQIQIGQQIPTFQYATKNSENFCQKVKNSISLDGAQISIQKRIPTFLGYFGSVNMVSVSFHWKCHF